MKDKDDRIQAQLPSLRAAIEDWLWLDPVLPQTQARIAEAELIVNWVLIQLGCDLAQMNTAAKAKFLFEQIGEPNGFKFWHL